MTSAERESLGSRIRSLRQERGLSLRGLAEHIELSPGYLSQLERGEAENPSRNVLEKAAEGLGVHISQLLGEEPASSGPSKIPSSLAEFLKDAETRGAPVPDQEVQMLLGIRYRGRQPRTAADWAYLYESIARSIK